MDQIALTRRVVAGPESLRDAIRVAVTEPWRRPGVWQRFGLHLVSWLILLVVPVVVLDVGRPGRAVLVAVLATVGRAVAVVTTTAWHVRRTRARDLAPGTELAAGVAPGVLRTSGPDDDGVLQLSGVLTAERRGDLVVFSNAHDGTGTYACPGGLLSDDDLAVLRDNPSATLPVRPDEAVALTHEVLLDEHWAARLARAAVTHSVRSPSWWVALVTSTAALVAVWRFVAGEPWSVGGLAVRAALLLPVTAAVWLVVRYRANLRAGVVPAEGIRVLAGIGDGGLRIVSPGRDVVHRPAGIREVRRYGDVALLRLAGGTGLLLPGELFDAEAVRRLTTTPA